MKITLSKTELIELLETASVELNIERSEPEKEEVKPPEPPPPVIDLPPVEAPAPASATVHSKSKPKKAHTARKKKKGATPEGPLTKRGTKRKYEVSQTWKEGTLCEMCGKPATPGYTICARPQCKKDRVNKWQRDRRIKGGSTVKDRKGFCEICEDPITGTNKICSKPSCETERRKRYNKNYYDKKETSVPDVKNLADPSLTEAERNEIRAKRALVIKAASEKAMAEDGAV